MQPGRICKARAGPNRPKTRRGTFCVDFKYIFYETRFFGQCDNSGRVVLTEMYGILLRTKPMFFVETKNRLIPKYLVSTNLLFVKTK